MKLKEQTKKRLDELAPKALAQVYDLITELRRESGSRVKKATTNDYLKVREALNSPVINAGLRFSSPTTRARSWL